jgi:D-alanine-D-alanine ligase
MAEPLNSHASTRLTIGRKRIVVLAGGSSSEREISLQSGINVANALRQSGNDVDLLDPAALSLESADLSHYDVAFIALHGEYGEDGQVQTLLEEQGIPYTGSPPAASRIGLSKSATKERLILAGLPTPEYAIVHKSDYAERLHGVARKIGYPLVVKPNSQGSSLGVSIIHHPAELPDALADCFSFEDFGLIEQFIPGEEWTVGLLDQTLLPPMRIETENQFFDYAAKYTDLQTQHDLAPDVPKEFIDRIGEIALSASTAVGTRGIVRVDLRVDREARPWILELNTIPGLTAHSLVPLAAASLGWSMSELCERAVTSALVPQVGRIPHRLTA